MNIISKLFGPKKYRVWGRNDNGTPYETGMTIGALRTELLKFNDTDEICVSIARKSQWNGGGHTGKLKTLETGSTGQVWFKARVLDDSQDDPT